MGFWPVRETKDSPNDEDVTMNSFETTGRSVGIQTAVRQKSKSRVQLVTDSYDLICFSFYAHFKADCQSRLSVVYI